MPRTFWKGVISFGLVSIPVKMYVGIVNKTPGLHLLHKKCLTRPRQVLHCEVDNEYFSIKETVRGYQVSKDQFVVLEPGDLEKVPIKSSRAIDIQGFAYMKEIDPIYYYDTHYIEPEELGAKPFRLLKEALEKTEHIGIAKVTFQRREHLGCLRPMENMLVLHSMYYFNEIVDRKELAPPPKPEVTKAEFDMAVTLIKSMSRPFNPEEYKDNYEEALNKVIKAKLEGKKIIAPKKPQVEVADLMEALRASVKAAEKQPVLR